MKTRPFIVILNFLGRFLFITALGIQVLAQTQPLTLRSYWPGSPSLLAGSAALSGDYAYVVGMLNGFLVLNVANPSQPQVTGYSEITGWCRGAVCSAIEVVPPYAYVANSKVSLEVIDISQPSSPTLVGECITNAVPESEIMQLRVVGTHAYLAGWTSGIQMYDVSNPARPRWVAKYRSGTFGNGGVDIVGQYAYVSYVDIGDVKNGGLDIVDVSNASQPRRVGSCALAGVVWQVRVAGTYAYVIGYEDVAGDAGRLHVIDVRDPANPVPVGVCAISSYQLVKLCVLGRYVLTPGEGQMHVIDVNDPANPVPIGIYPTSTAAGSSGGLSVAGDRACLALGPTIEMLDIKNPTQPLHAGELSFSWTMGVCVDGAVAYTAVQDTGGWPGYDAIKAINVGDPAKPLLAGEYRKAPAEHVAAFCASANRGYLLGRSGEFGGTSYLKILDLANPANPVPLGSWEVTSDEFSTLAVAGSRAYAVGYSRDEWLNNLWHFLIFDVSASAKPVLLGRYDFASGWVPGPFEVAGNYVYFLSETWGLTVLDISQPANPALVGHGEPLGWSTGRRMAVAGRWAYAPASGSLRVFDVGDPAHPTQVGLFQPKDTEIGAVQIIGQWAVVAGSSTAVSPSRGYLAVLDVGDPRSPTLVAEYQTKGETVFDLEAVGNTVYVADYNWGLAIYDFLPPTTTPRLRLNAPVLSSGVVVLTWQGGGPGIRLQKTTSLSTPNWQDVPGTDGQSLAVLPASDAAAFFRLMQR